MTVKELITALGGYLPDREVSVRLPSEEPWDLEGRVSHVQAGEGNTVVLLALDSEAVNVG